MSEASKILNEMNDRSREVFRLIVESYLDSGEPVGSRTLTRTLSEKVSAATVRNVMQDLEFLGLLDSPHVSAGRVPTQMGLRMLTPKATFDWSMCKLITARSISLRAEQSSPKTFVRYETTTQTIFDSRRTTMFD